MTLPITGPVRTALTQPFSDGLGGGTQLKMFRDTWKQKKPFDRPLRYQYELRRCEKSWKRWYPPYGDPTWSDLRNVDTTWSSRKPYSLYWGYDSAFLNDVNKSSSRCLERLKQKWLAGDRERAIEAQLGATVAEMQKSLDMMASRLNQIRRIAVGLRRCDFKTVWDNISLPSEVSRRDPIYKLKVRAIVRRGARDFSNTWLELWFGWLPLISDIHAAMEVLGHPALTAKVKATAKVKWYNRDVRTTNAYGYTSYVHTGYARTSMGGEIRIDNPNALLMERLGILNPATVAWELVPFSFLVNWFVNVDEWLGNLTSFAGTSFVNPWTNTTVVDSVKSTELYANGNQVRYAEMSAVSVERILTIPTVKLRFVFPWRLSPTRAATASALVIQQFLPKR